MLVRLYGLLGAVVEQYEVSLFYVLSLILAQQFFPADQDLKYSLIYLYLVIPLGALAKPLGGLWFGRLSDQRSPVYALTLTIAGMGLCTLAIACLPTYASCGLISTGLLITLKLCQAFCRGGECINAAIYTLDQYPKTPGLASGISCGTFVLGSLLASLVAQLIEIDTNNGHWRLAFAFGAFLSLLVFCIRLPACRQFKSEVVPSKLKNNLKTLLPIQRDTLKPLISQILVTTTLSALYCSTIFLGNWGVTTGLYTLQELFWLIQVGLLIYFFSLLGFGFLADRVAPEKIMRSSFWLAGLFCGVLYFDFSNPISKPAIIAIYLSLLILTAASFGPYHFWYRNLLPTSLQSQLSSFAYAIGAGLGGALPALAQILLKNADLHTNQILSALLFGFLVLGLFGLWLAKSSQLNLVVSTS